MERVGDGGECAIDTIHHHAPPSSPFHPTPSPVTLSIHTQLQGRSAGRATGRRGTFWTGTPPRRTSAPRVRVCCVCFVCVLCVAPSRCLSFCLCAVCHDTRKGDDTHASLPLSHTHPSFIPHPQKPDYHPTDDDLRGIQEALAADDTTRDPSIFLPVSAARMYQASCSGMEWGE